MKKSLKTLASLGLGLGILAGSTFSDHSMLAPKQADAASKTHFVNMPHVSGTFYVPRTATKVFTKNDYPKKAKTFNLKDGDITSNSPVKGTYKVYVQVRSSSKASWKNFKTFSANRNGKTYFSVYKIPNHYQYRFVLENPKRPLKPIHYSISAFQWPAGI